ncbi:MAG TPA: hypothetical protein VF601_04675 [Beijerinckiaceae bacterium]|jgi:hypothetical protein
MKFSFALILWTLLGPSVYCVDAAAAEILLVSRYGDTASNGSIDVDIALTSNMKDDDEVKCTYRLSGSINLGDAEKLKSLISSTKLLSGSPRLCLNSPGGSYREGLAIARILMEEWIGTAVEANSFCASACALIFMAGTAPSRQQLNRFLHVNGMLGFHSPYLRGGAQGSFAEGVQAINELVKLGRGRVPHFFDSDLVSEMLDKGPEELYLLDTIRKIIANRVALYGSNIPTFSLESLINVCINYFYRDKLLLKTEEIQKLARAASIKKYVNRINIEYDLAPRGGGCTVELFGQNDYYTSWIFYPPTALAGISLSYWYLYPPETKISDIPRLARH